MIPPNLWVRYIITCIKILRKNGFRFDLGPTIVTMPQLFEELWSFCGRKFHEDIDLIPCEPFYEVIFDPPFSVICVVEAEGTVE